MPIQARRQVIRENILSKTYEEIAEICYCSKRTIIRTINEWRTEGGFEQLLFDEFFKLYPRVAKEYPDKALDKLVMLIGKGMVRRAEILTDTTITERKEATFKLDPEDRKLLEATARRYIKTSNKAKSASIH